jgi:hypothetical protein
LVSQPTIEVVEEPVDHDSQGLSQAMVLQRGFERNDA